MGNFRRRLIRSFMVLSGVSQADIARELGVTRQTVNGVIAGHIKSRRVQEHISKRVGRTWEELWNDAEAKGDPQ